MVSWFNISLTLSGIISFRFHRVLWRTLLSQKQMHVMCVTSSSPSGGNRMSWDSWGLSSCELYISVMILNPFMHRSSRLSNIATFAGNLVETTLRDYKLSLYTIPPCVLRKNKCTLRVWPPLLLQGVTDRKTTQGQNLKTRKYLLFKRNESYRPLSKSVKDLVCILSVEAANDSITAFEHISGCEWSKTIT